LLATNRRHVGYDAVRRRIRGGDLWHSLPYPESGNRTRRGRQPRLQENSDDLLRAHRGLLASALREHGAAGLTRRNVRPFHPSVGPRSIPPEPDVIQPAGRQTVRDPAREVIRRDAAHVL